ncbi:MAG TPA: hypothetical protein VNO14_08165 [Blastocatellia bacterium]|nr:hypothetical protein [Blastocatellia bacterium]
MTTDANSQPGPGDAVRKAFSELPLDEKVATLIGMEMDLLGDVAGAFASSASKFVDDLAQAFNDLCSPSSRPSPQGDQTAPNA